MKRLSLMTIVLVAVPLQAVAGQDLLDVYQLAVDQAPRLISAHATSKAADARYRQARGELWPHLSLDAGYSKVKTESLDDGGNATRRRGGGLGGTNRARNNNSSDTEDFNNQYSLSLNFSQALFNWSAWQAMDAADLRAAGAEYKLRFAQAKLMLRTTRRYLDTLAARTARKAAQQKVEVIQKQLGRARAAWKSGLAPITNLQQAKSKLDAVRVDLIQATNQLANTRDSLFLFIGKQVGNLEGASAPFKIDPPKASNASRWIQSAMQINPKLAAKRKALAAARQVTNQAQGRRLPTLKLTGSIGRRERVPNIAIAGDKAFVSNTYSIGLQLSMPIFAGGTIAAAVDEAQAKAIQAHQQLITARRQIKTNTRTAFRNLQANAQRVQALAQAIESGKTAVQAAKAGMRNGTRNILDVMEAEIALIQRRVSRQQAWFDYIIAGLKLKQLAGTLTVSDLKRINARLVDKNENPGSD